MYNDRDNRSSSSYQDSSDRSWSRDRFNDHRKDRYDSYNRVPAGAYHRERDHRDRDRDRRIDKRR